MAAGKKDQEKNMSKKGAVKQPQRSVSFEEKLIGTADEEYNLISILYHALQGAETYLDYIEDAAESGDEELLEFVRDVHREEIQIAHRAKILLFDRLACERSGVRPRSDEGDELDEDRAPIERAPDV